MIDVAFSWSDLIVVLLTFACLGILSGLLLSLKDRFLTSKSRPRRSTGLPPIPPAPVKKPAAVVKPIEPLPVLKPGRKPVKRLAKPAGAKRARG
jgi:hypothetical protein